MNRQRGFGGMVTANVIWLVLLLALTPTAPGLFSTASAQAAEDAADEPVEGPAGEPAEEPAEDPAPVPPVPVYAPQILAPVDGTVVQPDQTIGFTGVGCEPGGEVAFRAAQGTFFDEATAIAAQDGGFAASFRVDAPVEPGQELFTTQVSCGGNSAQVTLVVERPPAPMLQITEPADGTRVRPGQQLTVRGKGCDPGTTVEGRLPIGTFTQAFTVTADGNGDFVATFVLPGTFEGARQGQLTIACSGRTDSVRLVLEEPAPPVLEITEPADGTRVRPGQELVVRGQGCDPDATVEGQLVISTFATPFTVTADGDGSFAARLVLPGTFEGDRDGEVRVACSGRTDGVTLVLAEPASPAPVLQISEPDNGDRVRPGQQLTVRGKGCDPNATVRGELRVSTFTYRFKTTADGDGVFAVRITLPKTFEGDRDGELQVSCSGRSDNVTLVLQEDNGQGNGGGRQVPKGAVQTGAGGTAGAPPTGPMAAAAALVTLGIAAVVSVRVRGRRALVSAVMLPALALALVACNSASPGETGAPPTILPAPDSTVAPPTPVDRDVALLASEPTRIEIPSIGVDSQIIKLGLNPDQTMEVPQDFAVAGWYQYLPTPGERGPAIIAGHIDSKAGPAVFFRLRELQPGAEIRVTRADGSVALFSVDRLEQFPKAEFPTQRVYGDLDHAGLRLITCGGSFDSSIGHYRDNIVAYATLTASA